MKDISIIIEQSFLFQFDFFLPFGLTPVIKYNENDSVCVRPLANKKFNHHLIINL